MRDPKLTNRKNFTRRQALQLGTLAGLSGISTSACSRPLGSNTDIRLGFAGLRNKGTEHINQFRKIPGCRIVALCDVDQEFLDRESAACAKAKEPITTYRDFRDMIASPEIDAVVIASPNHWHALMGVWALQAGKHIYVEKPLTHSIWEGEQLVAAAEASGLVAQTGTQRRSDMAYPEAKEWLDSGAIGAIVRARAVVYSHRNRVNKRKSPTKIPTTLDYDRWCGPAQVETLYRSKVHYDWHWRWNTGNGELCNNGIHFIDTARLLLGDPGLPKRTLSIGGRFAWNDDAGQTPNTHLTLFDGEIPISCEVRNLPMKPGMEAVDHQLGIRMGTIIECEGGHIAWPVAYDKAGKKIKKFKSDDGHGHGVNWLKAIVDNRPGDVHAPLRNGHISTAYCLLGNLSHRLGTGAPSGKIAAEIADDAATGAAFDSMCEHLKTNLVDLAKTPFTLGRLVKSDASSLGGALAPEAKALDRREMRAPYQLG